MRNITEKELICVECEPPSPISMCSDCEHNNNATCPLNREDGSEVEKALNGLERISSALHAAEPQEPKTVKSWDGYDIPVICQTENKECGMCELSGDVRETMGCNVNPFDDEEPYDD
jgi:hypothetical protein